MISLRSGKKFEKNKLKYAAIHKRRTSIVRTQELMHMKEKGKKRKYKGQRHSSISVTTSRKIKEKKSKVIQRR